VRHGALRAHLWEGSFVLRVHALHVQDPPVASWESDFLQCVHTSMVILLDLHVMPSTETKNSGAGSTPGEYWAALTWAIEEMIDAGTDVTVGRGNLSGDGSCCASTPGSGCGPCP
jgi:hypothetical protein